MGGGGTFISLPIRVAYLATVNHKEVAKMRFNGDVTVSQRGAEFVSADGFEAIAGHNGLFIRQTATGKEIAFNTETAGSTVVTLK